MADSKKGREARIRSGVYQNSTVLFVALTHGREAIIEPGDWRRVVAEYGRRWMANSNGRGRWYAKKEICRADGRSELITLGRAVTGAQPGERVEVVNGDPLDCRRANLRVIKYQAAVEIRRQFAIKRSSEVRP